MTEAIPVRCAPRIGGVDGLLELLDAARAHTAGNDVDLLAHALQCAALLERAAPTDIELQVAGLVHDLGTVLAPDVPEHHARIGADAVRQLLGSRVADLVGGHDQAKRYLVTVDAGYRHSLSAGSRATLRGQGGLLDPGERAAFTSRPDAEPLLALRRADDAAKEPARLAPGLEHWTIALYAVAARTPRRTRCT